MAKYRLKPAVVDAYQMPFGGPDVPASFLAWCEEVGLKDWCSTCEGLAIRTCGFVSPGDWIVKGVSGVFFVLKPTLFASTYEPIPTETSERESLQFPVLDHLG